MVADFGLARDIYESGAYETTTGVRPDPYILLTKLMLSNLAVVFYNIH